MAGWIPDEYLIYIDVAEGRRINIGGDKFLHSVRIAKQESKQLWLVVVQKNDRCFKVKALTYIANHPELDIQWWRSYKEMYQDTEGMGRTILERVCWLAYDPGEGLEIKTIKEWLDDGYTWQQVLNNKDKIIYPVLMSDMDVE